MPWEGYLDRIQFHCQYLKNAFQEGRFSPDALIGVSNGGLVAADIMGKAILPPSDIPVLALWASRFSSPKTSSSYYYFDNPYNDAMTKSLMLSIENRPDKRPKIILVDDHMGTGQTSLQAIDYLINQFTEADIVFIPLVSRRIKQVKKLLETYFPYNLKSKSAEEIFHVTESEFLDKVYTDYEFLPYLDKEINKSSSSAD